MAPVPAQTCPNCHRKHDTSVYVTGQKLRCQCGIAFEVRRTDVTTLQGKAPLGARSMVGVPQGAAGSPAGEGAEPGSTRLGPRANIRPPVASEGLERAAAAAPVAGEPDRVAFPIPGAEAPAGAVVPPGATVAYAHRLSADRGDRRAPNEAVPIAADALPVEPEELAFVPDAFLSSARAAAAGAEGNANTFVTPAHATPALDIPGFDLLEVVGRGGMGEVWRARQVSLSRTVAVKVLPQKLAKDAEFVTRFEKEAHALAALNHPNIIQIIDRGAVGENYYFVMEFVVGRSLRELMSDGRLPPSDALKIIAQVCRAIDYAHEAGIIHRDLKPENILIDDRGHVKVADFGLAGIRGEKRLQLTATRVAMGTVNYMAPEQRRDAKNVDGRADLYSLGVVLYELLTGELPIGRFKLPSEQLEGLDVRLDEIVVKTLESDPGARFQRASEVGHALESMISSVPTHVPTPLPDGVSGYAPTSVRPPSTSPGRRAAALEKVSSVARTGAHGLRTGLAVVGALGLLAFGARWASERFGTTAPPPNTDGNLFVVGALDNRGDILALSTTFAEATHPEFAERIRAHAGHWALENGKLSVVQVGDEVSGNNVKLVPRAYWGDRYFRADRFSAETWVALEPLSGGYRKYVDGNGFAEVAFRRRDVQVSVFAIPGVGMRLGWRYFTPDGQEMQGNSSRDIDELTEDPTSVPTDAAFRMSLQLRPTNGGVEAIGYVNERPFARKILPGLQGQVGRPTVGCRNLHCEFAKFDVQGQPEDRPAGAKGAPVE